MVMQRRKTAQYIGKESTFRADSFRSAIYLPWQGNRERFNLSLQQQRFMMAICRLKRHAVAGFQTLNFRAEAKNSMTKVNKASKLTVEFFMIILLRFADGAPGRIKFQKG